MSIIKIPMAGSIGLITDPYEQDAPLNAWSRVRNTRFGDRGAQAFNGHELVMPGETDGEGCLDCSALVLETAGASAPFAGIAAANGYTPCTLMCWIKQADKSDDNHYTVMGLYPATDADDFGWHAMLVFGASAGPDTLKATTGTTFASFNTTGGAGALPDDEWAGVVVEFAAPDSRTAHAEGGSDTGLVSRSPSNLSRIVLGSYAGAIGGPFAGKIAQAAVWFGTMTADQRAAWFDGANALEVQAMDPSGARLISYWPGRFFEDGADTYLEDIVGGNHLLIHAAAVWDGDAPPVNEIRSEEPLPITPLWVKNYPDKEIPRWAYADNNTVYCAQEGSHTEITRVSDDYNATERWQGSLFNGVGILNSGGDAPQMWAPIDKDTELEDLDNWPADYLCRFIKPFKNYLIAGNIYDGSDNYPYRILWSDEADPGSVPPSWDVSDPTTNAGEFDLTKTSDHIVDGLDNGDLFIVYREGTTYAMSLTGDSEIFRRYEISNQFGILWKDCVAQIPGGHIVATWDDLVFHAGNAASFRSVLEKRDRRLITAELNREAYKNAFIVLDEPEREVWFCFPQMGYTYANFALVWNWATGAVGHRDLPNVPFADSGPVLL